MAISALRAASFLTLALVSFSGLPASAEEPAKTETKAEAKPLLPAIVVTKVVERKMIDRIIVTGNVKPVEEIYVQPLVEGLSIKSLSADVGDHVDADAVLAVLNDDTLLLQKSQLEASKAKVEAARAQVDAQLVEAQSSADEAVRQSKLAAKLADSGSGSRSQADQLKAAADAALARLNSAKQGIPVNDADMKVIQSQIDDIDLKLARTSVKTTVSGVISARNAKIGAIASGAGQPLFTIIRDGELEVSGQVTEADILKLLVGQKVNMKVAGTAEVITGAVRRIDPTIDPATRLGTVQISIDDESRARDGMFASAEIIIAERMTPALPVTAVTSAKTGTVARKVDNAVVKMAPVTTGIQDGAFIEIASGLSVGDAVVAKAGAYVRDGDHINPVDDVANVSN